MNETSQPIVLVIEDSDDDFYAFERVCRRLDIPLQLRRCRSGADARTYLSGLTPGHGDWPVLIFLDLNMPGIDGRTLLQDIKTSPTLRLLRVVVYSTSDSPSDIQFCYSNFANAYHTKPRDYSDMRADLSEILSYWLNKSAMPDPELESAE